MIEAGAVDAILPHQPGLPAQGGNIVEPIVVLIQRHTRLVVVRVQGLGPANVRPLGEALTPPRVVLRDGMKLRQIKSQDAGHAVRSLPITLRSVAAPECPGATGT